MGKPVPGDPEVDVQGKLLAEEIAKTVTHRACRNYDQKTAKKLRKAMAHALVELDDAIITKIQQGIGGVRGNR